METINNMNAAQGQQAQDAFGAAMPDMGQGGYARFTGSPQAGYQQVGPQSGGIYQFQAGVGFVQVQNPVTMQAPTVGAQGMNPMDMGQADMGQAAQSATPGTPEGAESKFDQKKLGEMYGMVNDVVNGEADPAKLLGLLAGTGGDFWKGALVGAAAVFLLNNDAVKGAVAGTFGSFFGNEDETKAEK